MNIFARSIRVGTPVLWRSWPCLAAGWLMLCAGVANAEAPRDAVQAANAAGLRLFVQSFPAGANGSLAPLSITSALAMLHAGAEHETRRQLTSFLAGDLSPAVIAEYPALLRELALDPPANGAAEQRLAFTASLWSQQGFPVAESFQQHLQGEWGLAVRPLDFRHELEASRGVIADWYAEQDPLLRDMPVAGISDQTRLYLATAASLRAAWFARFKPAEPGTFQISPDQAVACEVMRLTLPTGYWAGDGVQAVRIPFQGKRLTAVLLAPESAEVMARVEETMAAGRLPFDLQAFERKPVSLQLVKFRHRFPDINLRAALSACGVDDLFTREAKLAGIGPNLYLDAVQYEGEFSLDENGCQATAAAGLNVIIKAEPVPFATDRPFLYFVMDEPTGLVLFVGRVQDPSADPDWNASSRSL